MLQCSSISQEGILTRNKIIFSIIGLVLTNNYFLIVRSYVQVRVELLNLFKYYVRVQPETQKLVSDFMKEQAGAV